MGVFCPLYFLAVAIAKGSVTAIAFYQLVLFIIYLVELVIAKILLPMIHIYMILRLLNYLSKEDYLSKFACFLDAPDNVGCCSRMESGAGTDRSVRR